MKEENSTAETQDMPVSFDSWCEQQDEATQNLIRDHIQGLENSLQEGRKARRKLKTDLRETAKNLKAGSEAQVLLTESADKLAMAERRIIFLEQAKDSVKDTKLAWLAICNDHGKYEEKNGAFDFEKLKADYPSLFVDQTRPTQPKGNAGNGTQSDQKSKVTMNEWLKAALSF